MKQDGSTELSGHSFLKIYDKMPPPPPPTPQTPNPDLSRSFVDCVKEIGLFRPNLQWATKTGHQHKLRDRLGRVQGWQSVCWGLLRILGFSFLGCLVSEFLDFSNSFISVWYIGTILPIFHFTFFDRYWSHIHDFQNKTRWIFTIVRRTSFQKLPNCWSSDNLIFPNIIRFKCFVFSWFCLGVLASPKIKQLVFGSRGHVQKS